MGGQDAHPTRPQEFYDDDFYLIANKSAVGIKVILNCAKIFSSQGRGSSRRESPYQNGKIV
jgi:hypothetical protein